MQLLVISHKLCWHSADSPTGFATDGGFPAQIEAVSHLFTSTRVAVPVGIHPPGKGESPIRGLALSVVPLTEPAGLAWRRKLEMPGWLARNIGTLWREARSADAIYALIPGDIGLLGLMMGLLLRKPLFARYCGNWHEMKSPYQTFTRWLMERTAGGRNVMLATGGDVAPPSPRYPNVRWIFSTSLRRSDLQRCATAQSRTNAPLRLINSCRQEPYKRTELVIQSMPLLLQRFPDVTLDIVGDGSSIPALRRTAEDLGLSGRVRFHGHVPQSAVIPLLQNSSVFCYPTATEGFPKAVLEALACGLPVVTTPVSVLPRLVPDGVAGVLLPDPSPANIASAIERCAADPEVYGLMSSAASRQALRYSLEAWNAEVGQLLAAAWGGQSVVH
jgi:glycosyltransferase involved in cell wall biosynthesis